MTFHDLPGHARLWVHTADRDLKPEEQQDLLAKLGGFLGSWSAHGAALLAAAEVLYGRVLVVGLDEQQAGATGCSIDKLVGFVRAHGAEAGINWFDRHQVVWRQPGGKWAATRTSEFWAMRKAGVVSGETEVVDPLVSSLNDARSDKGYLVKTFDESWHAEMWS
ncbi:MAG: hypothetical protein CMC97_04765 [Flavobacteriales bacterium]|nr:hypothetical protein [Flavobacteriales bacterium]